MAYGVTPKGFISKPFQAILDSMVERSKEEFGDSLPTDPQTVAGQFLNIIAYEMKDVWDMGEGVADTGNRARAEGVYLDFLAKLAGLTRQAESGSTGQILFTGNESTFISKFSVAKDLSNRNVLTQEETTLNRANCYQSTFSINILQDNTDYTINIEGVDITVDSQSGATIPNILNSLDVNINASTLATSEVVGETIVVSFPSFNNNLTTTNSSNMTLDSLGSLVSSESAEVGSSVNFDKDTVNILVSSILGISSVNNPQAFQNGRDQESDEELRIRMDNRVTSTGTATKPSIETALSEVDGVTYALVKVNDTLTDDTSTGIPAKHYETFINGGDEDEIAEVMWTTKSLFGNTFGTIDKTVIDQNGDTQSVKFSRPSSKTAWVRVTYTINDEEVFPSDGEERLKSVVVSHGNAMYKGEDLAPTKFYGSLYTVQGVYISLIEVAITNLPTDTPTYTTNILPVAETEDLLFSTEQVILTT